MGDELWRSIVNEISLAVLAMYIKCSECANCRAYNLFGGIKSSFPVIYDSHNGPKFTKKRT